jgi:mitogen-activated protein kinase 1/3
MFPVGPEFHLLKMIGQGGFGTVVRAIHEPTGANVAIKKIENVFSSAHNARRLLREIQILRQMGYNRSVVQLKDVLEPKKDLSSFTTIYYVFEA